MTDDLPEHREKPPFVMYDMIKDIPAGIRKTLSQMRKTNFDFLSKDLFLTGNGTAFHAATIGAQILDSTPLKWASIQAYEIQHYRTPKGALVAFSHTGKTKSTVDAVRKYKDEVITVGVSHYKGTPLLTESDYGILIDSPDLSLCNTKAFFDNAFSSLEIACNYADIDSDSTELLKTVEENVRSGEKEIREIADKLQDIKDIFVLGSGPNLIAARETAQKLKEATHLHAEGIELEEFNHGCTSVIDEHSLVIIIDSKEDRERASQISRACHYTQTKTLMVNGEGNYSFHIDEPEKPSYFPFSYMVQMYYLAYFLALTHGINPDYLRFEDKRYMDFDSVIFPPGAH